MAVGLFLLSMLAAGEARAQDVLWYYGHGGLSPSTSSSLEGALSTAGSTGMTKSSTWPGSSITSYKLVFLSVNTSTFSSTEITDIQTYLDTGNVLVIIGEAYAYSTTSVSTLN